MTITMAVCDDEVIILDTVEYNLSNISKSEGLNIQLNRYCNPEILLKEISEYPNRYSIILLDVRMPEMNGIHLGKIIKEQNKNICIIYISGYDEYVIDSYDVKAFYFIKKPIMEEKFKDVIMSAINEIENKNLESTKLRLTITHNYQPKVISYEDILYITKIRNKLRIKCKDGEYYHYAAIKDIKSQLLGEIFIQCNQGCLVNVNKIKDIEKNIIKLNNGEKISISRERLKKIRRMFFGDFRK